MTYGLTFEDIKNIKKPKIVDTEWGHYCIISNNEFYGFQKFFIKKQGVQPLHYHLSLEGVLYIQTGSVTMRLIDKNGKEESLKLTAGNTFKIYPKLVYGISGLEDSYIYLFSNGFDETDYYTFESQKDFKPDTESYSKIGKTTDFRDKYWGSIETIVDGVFCGKKIAMKKSTQNSLEFHCNKYETYYVHSGTVKVGVRIGRGENKSVLLKEGSIFDIPPGLMHMKIAVEDCIVFEISTKDDDKDSHLVEDGRKYIHKEKN